MAKYEHTIIAQGTNKYLEVEKKRERGQYTDRQVLEQALEKKRADIKEDYARRGKEISHAEVVREAAKIAEHREKLFKK